MLETGYRGLVTIFHAMTSLVRPCTNKVISPSTEKLGLAERYSCACNERHRNLLPPAAWDALHLCDGLEMESLQYLNRPNIPKKEAASLPPHPFCGFHTTTKYSRYFSSLLLFHQRPCCWVCSLFSASPCVLSSCPPALLLPRRTYHSQRWCKGGAPVIVRSDGLGGRRKHMRGRAGADGTGTACAPRAWPSTPWWRSRTRAQERWEEPGNEQKRERERERRRRRGREARRRAVRLGLLVWSRAFSFRFPVTVV